MSNEQYVTNNIKVQNNDMEVLRKNFPQCFDKDGNFDIEKFTNQLKTQNSALKTDIESYSLEWLGKSYARLLANEPTTTLLKEDKEHNQKEENRNAENLLIKGDNLEVLKHLYHAYKNRIKMIYIDPPYNTGSDDFVYQDDRKYSVKELQELIGIDEEKAKRIFNFTNSKSNSHSAWLTFMYPRLYLAQKLLKEEGLIYVSIDDSEVAQLKLLMDEIFGDENFVAKLIWKKKAGGGNDNKYFVTDHEYILVYAKLIDKIDRLWVSLSKEQVKKYTLRDEFYKERGPYLLKNLYQPSLAEDRPNLKYPIKCPDGSILHIKDDGEKYIWRWEEKKYFEGVENKRIEFRKIKGNWQIFTKQYLRDNDEGIVRRTKPRSVLTTYGMTKNGKLELKILFDDKVIFNYPKTIRLISYLISVNTNENDIILDFFAGSGTTGDSVMQLNAEDGGNRKYILVQIPEKMDAKKNKTAYNFVKNELKAEPTIFEITKERLIRAAIKIDAIIKDNIVTKENQIKTIEGKLDLEDNETSIEQLEAEINRLKNQDLGFKIFETMPIWEDYNFEAEKFDTSQTLFDAGKLTEEDIQSLLLTWKTYDNIPLTQELESLVLSSESLVEEENKEFLALSSKSLVENNNTDESNNTIEAENNAIEEKLTTKNSQLKTNNYVAYYGKGKLYLMYKDFKTENLKNLLEKIDNDKNFNPTSIYAFGYHFESKSLRELSENIKSYKNKKGSENNIEFIVRY